MRVEEFAMERLQSTWENLVEINLSESGVHPLRVADLVDRPDLQQALLNERLVYTQSNGTPELRRLVAALYPGATEAHIEITNGGAEANYVVLWHLVEPGDEIVMMTPNYMQGWGLARAFGGGVARWWLREGMRAGRPAWRADLDELDRLVTPRTKLILICNPNNPTGARLTAEELDAVCRIAARHGAWVMADEIYRGAELDGIETASVWGRYERVVVTSGLSKAYGLPGLRIGWIAGPPELIARLWSYHDYTTIAPSALGDWLARIALAPDRRPRLLDRTRRVLRENYPRLRAWIDAHEGWFRHIPPEAGAIAYVAYTHPINSSMLVARLRDEQSVLVVPGDHFGMDGYLRFGFGVETPLLQEGLQRIDRLLSALAVHAG
ncbi:MAG TPA: aminotransferase class I/II-fold pyridoxal phosphate-dependent enzyme [Vicinamibacterales bacterium]|nr:aminotransferase class I/II-fold pyridoxal phosphate-dependent enzyme [Vicinamibacterales bacterium]